MRDQISAGELKRLHIAANAGADFDSSPGDSAASEVSDLLDQIRDLTVALDVCDGKLKRERSISKKLRAEVKGLAGLPKAGDGGKFRR